MNLTRLPITICFTSSLIACGTGILSAQVPTITSIAGSVEGFSGDGGPANQSEFSDPGGIAVDASGNVFFTDTANVRVREITAAGLISTVAGNGQTIDPNATSLQPAGPALDYALAGPTAITVRKDGTIFFADFAIINAVSPSGTLTPDPANTANDLASDSNGNVYGITSDGSEVYLYTPGAPPQIVAGNSANPNSGVMTSGDGGPATQATFNTATALAVDAAGNIYVADAGDDVVRKFKPGGNITTVAGIAGTTEIFGLPNGDGGAGTQANLSINPLNGSIAVDGSGNLYIAESRTIRKVAATTGTISTYAGNGNTGKYLGDGGPALQSIIAPQNIAVDSAGNLYVVNVDSIVVSNLRGLETRILKITPASTGGGSPSPVIISAVISSGGNVPGLTPGGFVTIYGTDLSSTMRGWMTSDFVGNLLPTVLSGVSVIIDGKPAGVNFISPGQLNVVVPDDTTIGPVEVIVTNNTVASAPFSVPISAYAPAFFTLDGAHIVAQHLNYNLIAASGFTSTSSPAAVGETIIIYGTGFGSTTPPTPSNSLVTAAAPLSSLYPLSLTIGGMPAHVEFAGIIASGLYQLNVTVPQVPSGDQPIVATLGSTSTQAAAVLPIQ